MRNLLLIFFLLLSSFGWVQADDGLCFKAFQGGREVNVICVGQPVMFVNCSEPTPSTATILFYPGKKAEITDDNRDFEENESYNFPEVGKYTITLILNRTGNAEYLEREFEVKATPEISFTAAPCANRTVNITITDQQYDNYTIDFGDGRRQPVNKGDDPVTHTYTAAGPYNVKVTGSYDNSVCTSVSAPQTVNELQPYTAPAISKLEVGEQDASTGSIIFTFSGLQDGYTYTLARKLESESNFTPIGNLPPGSTSYTLSNTNTELKATYLIESRDNCGVGQISSNSISNLVLQVTTANEKNTIAWQSLQTFRFSELFRNNELVQVSNPRSPYTDQEVTYGQEHCYHVISTEDDAVSVSAVQCVVVIDEQDAQLYIPSAFTPNGDELNDLFEVKGRYIKDFTISIYSGTGQLVYTSTNREEAWDGTFKGSPLPAGAYAYVVIVTSANNKVKRRTGTVTLLR